MLVGFYCIGDRERWGRGRAGEHVNYEYCEEERRAKRAGGTKREARETGEHESARDTIVQENE